MEFNSHKNKYSTIIWVGLALIIAVYLLVVGVDTGNQTLQDDKIVIILDYGDSGSQQEFAGSFQKDVRVWDLLQQATALSNTTLVATGNFLPEKIDNYSNGDGGKQWKYYINNEIKNSPPFETMASSGDTVVFKFE